MRILIIVAVFFMGFTTPEEGVFTVNIYQDGKLVPIKDGECTLERKPFKIRLKMKNLEGVYVHASFSDSLYSLSDSLPIPGMKDVPPNVMAEESFNKDHEVLIDNASWCYWFFKPNLEWHRLDKDIVIEDVTVTANKSVRQVYLVEKEKTLAVEDMQDPLYFFFFSAQEDDKNEIDAELQRGKLKILWK